MEYIFRKNELNCFLAHIYNNLERMKRIDAGKDWRNDLSNEIYAWKWQFTVIHNYTYILYVRQVCQSIWMDINK